MTIIRSKNISNVSPTARYISIYQFSFTEIRIYLSISLFFSLPFFFNKNLLIVQNLRCTSIQSKIDIEEEDQSSFLPLSNVVPVSLLVSFRAAWRKVATIPRTRTCSKKKKKKTTTTTTTTRCCAARSLAYACAQCEQTCGCAARVFLRVRARVSPSPTSTPCLISLQLYPRISCTYVYLYIYKRRQLNFSCAYTWPHADSYAARDACPRVSLSLSMLLRIGCNIRVRSNVYAWCAHVCMNVRVCTCVWR